VGELLVALALAGGAFFLIGYALVSWQQDDRLEAAGLVGLALLAIGLLLERARI
jgi:hypothetical protein